MANCDFVVLRYRLSERMPSIITIEFINFWKMNQKQDIFD
jgi:hypothetical protein